MVWRFQVYGIEDTWYLTPDLQVDQAFWSILNSEGNLLVVSPPISIGHAKALINCLQSSIQQTLQQDSSQKKGFFFRAFLGRLFVGSEKNNASIEQKIMNCQNKLKIEDFKNEIIQLNPDGQLEKRYADWWNRYASYYQGKLLLQEEIEKHLILFKDRTIFKQKSNDDYESGINDVARMLQFGYLKGDITWDSGVNHELICHRCGSTEKVYIRECASCGEACATCDQCITMGRSKTCAPLVGFRGNDIKLNPKASSYLSLSLSLTTAQQNISAQIVDFIKSKQEREMLVWAVTGAGKTEMIFQGIDEALAENYKVLLATPRKDVVRELAPRFAQAFPNIEIVSLYGGSHDKWKSGEIYLTTTHQTMRFVSFFDIIFIDEMDAFPYHNDPMLHYVVKRALKPSGQMIYLTATPAKEWQRKVVKNEVKSAILPIRYHGQPLPVPELKLIPKKETILKQAKPIAEIVDFFQKVVQREGQAFIFVPMVKDVPIWADKLSKWFPEFQDKVVGVHAGDKERDHKITHFRQGEITFMVTTTIMERGVTVPNVHVLVLGAESKVFDEATLVQIAGRVGRSSAYPAGIVTLLAEYNKNDIIKAKKQIQSMNQLAKQIKEQI